MSRRIRRAMQVAAVVVGAAVPLLGLPTAQASVPAAYTCTGGSIPSNTYKSVTVTGFCRIDSGDVTVNTNFLVANNAGLDATYAGSNLHVLGNFTANPGSIVLLGCEPGAFTCSNNNTSVKPLQPDGNATYHDIDQSINSNGALMFIAHHNDIGRDVSQSGGGGGVTCDIFPFGSNGPPAYSTWEDNWIGRNASVSAVRTCWLGFIRNYVGGTANYNQNVTADPDGNEVVTNSVYGNLICLANSPAAGFGFDSGGAPNWVGGQNVGQCPVGEK